LPCSPLYHNFRGCLLRICSRQMVVSWRTPCQASQWQIHLGLDLGQLTKLHQRCMLFQNSFFLCVAPSSETDHLFSSFWFFCSSAPLGFLDADVVGVFVCVHRLA
jgi:hypothetical protein